MSWFWFVIRSTGVGFRRSLPEIQNSSLGAQDRSSATLDMTGRPYTLRTAQRERRIISWALVRNRPNGP